MNDAPPILIASTVIVTNKASISAKVINRIITSSPFIIGTVNIAK